METESPTLLPWTWLCGLPGEERLWRSCVWVTQGTEAKEGQRVGDVKRDRDRGSVGFWEEARCLKGEAFPKERKALDHPVTLWQTPALPSIHSVKLNYLPQGDTY